MQTPTLEQVNAIMRMSIPLIESTRIECVALERGYAKTVAPIEGNGNHLQTMYAGVLFTVAEVLGGALAAATFDMARYAPLVKGVTIDFKKPARTDVSAEVRLSEEAIEAATAQADAEGKGEYELECTITDADGVVVATTVGQYQIRPHAR